MSDTIRMFVYGTLKAGMGNSYFMRNSELLGAATLEPVISNRSTRVASYHMIYTRPPITIEIVHRPQSLTLLYGRSSDESVMEFRNPICLDSSVKGEVYEVPITDLPAIDSLEGHPNWYTRQKIDIKGYGKCWVYLMTPTKFNQHSITLVEDGEYKGSSTKTIATSYERLKFRVGQLLSKQMVKVEGKKPKTKKVTPEISSEPRLWIEEHEAGWPPLRPSDRAAGEIFFTDDFIVGLDEGDR